MEGFDSVHGVYVDHGYRTRLGLPFYDRLRELGLLNAMVRGWRTVVVYGPRNVGKSELVRYYAARRASGRGFLFIDARRRAVEQLGLEVSVARELLGFVDRLVAGVAGVPSLTGLAEHVMRLYRRLLASELVVVVDEFHLLYPVGEEALAELERVAGYLAKTGEPRLRLVVTVSEGFIALGRARRRLLGYSTGYMLVEGLDRSHMAALHAGYASRYGCGVGFNLYWRIFGGAPGYLVEACPHTPASLLNSYLPSVLRDTVDEALAEASAGLSEPLPRVLGYAASLLAESEKGYTVIEDPRLQAVAEKLVEYNVLYPCRRGGMERYLPQLPVYAVAIQVAAEKGYARTSLIPANELEEAMAESRWSEVRCEHALQGS